MSPGEGKYHHDKCLIICSSKAFCPFCQRYKHPNEALETSVPIPSETFLRFATLRWSSEALKTRVPYNSVLSYIFGLLVIKRIGDFYASVIIGLGLYVCTIFDTLGCALMHIMCGVLQKTFLEKVLRNNLSRICHSAINWKAFSQSLHHIWCFSRPPFFLTLYEPQ